MATYHVFIERPRDSGATAAAHLANAVADRYGIPATTLIERLAGGRLRVKTGVDLDTAETFAADLEALGAVCTIVDAATNAQHVPAPAPAPPPPAPRAAPASAFSSALSAARADAPAQDLGALSSGEYALATLDGNDDGAVAHSGNLPASFGPPAEQHLPASMGPPIDMGPAPADMFAPPDSQDMPELALDIEKPSRVIGTTAPPQPAPATIAAAPEDPPTRVTRGPGLAGWLRDARLRLAGGVLVAILLGFIPATLVTSMRERSAFGDIDKDLSRTYARATDERTWLRLDEDRAHAIQRKKDARHDIVLGSLLVWALAGAGVAFVWFRVIDWDALANRF